MRTTVQFMLSKFAIAWMFALITINFNRVAIYDLGIAAVLVTTMIGLYPFFGPLQPVFGRITSRYPIFGYRRSPYLLIGMVVGSLVFPPLPSIAVAMAAGSLPAIIAGFALFFLFGAMIALMANTFLDLVAECTTEETRGKVLAGAWTGQTFSIVLWALAFRFLMPEFSIASMQLLYNITPVVVLLIGILSIIGLERRLTPDEVREARSNPHITADTAPIRESLALLGNPAARSFFLFVLLSFPAIFLQDALQEVFGGEVLNMTVGETTVFQQIFNGTVTVGMALTGALGARMLGISGGAAALPMAAKKKISTIGGLVASLCLVLQAVAAAAGSLLLFNLALALFGLGVGVFTFAAVTMMSDMTVTGQTARYLGLWSLAQAVGLGTSFILAGVLHSLLIGSGLLAAPVAYALIFVLEGGCMVFCVLAVRGASPEALQTPVRGTAAIAA
jgi:BCD family chlorophyll transporter-like MFS transporter